MRSVIATNVTNLINHHYRHLPNVTKRQHALAADAKIGHGTVQRAMKADVATGIDALEAMADALHVSVYQLMIPNLDAQNPQIVAGVSEEEQRAYRRWKRGMDATKAAPAHKDKSNPST